MKMDKYYKSVVDNYGEHFLGKAGYFEEIDVPLVEVIDNIHIDKEGDVILLTTGSFAPMHEGHVDMMNKAVSFCEKQGIKVCASIFSFSHDDYVLTKDNNIPHKDMRIKIAEEKIKETTHQLSMWELNQLKPVNFTTVIDYVVNKYQKPVIYVFGKDNYYFAYAFNTYGKGLYIPTDHIDELEYEYIKKLPNVSVLPKSDYKLNSRNLRKNVYVIRDDSDFLNFNQSKLNQFVKSLAESIHRYTNHPIKIINAKEQVSKRYTTSKTISLDLYYEGDYRLEVSRYFKFKQEQKRALFLDKRIYSEEIETQIKKIPKGEYSLIDDDIASGFTTSAVIKTLNQFGIVINDVISLNPITEGMYDIVDVRDFIIGAKNSGLQVENNGLIFKVPYIFPYVDLINRAKILYPKEFSFEILQYNLSIYKGSGIRIMDLEEHKMFLQKIGYQMDDLVEDVIKSMAKECI